MALRPLLPLVEGGVIWREQGKNEGINPEEKNNFIDRLYKLDSVEASGIPSLFNHPFVIYTKLNIGDSNTFKNFSTLVRGIFLGVIKLKGVKGNLRSLENVAKKVKANFNDFIVLEWKGQPIGGIYPDCLVFPGAKFEDGEYGDDVKWDGLSKEVEKIEKQIGSDIVKALFKRWGEEIEKRWEEGVRKILELPKEKDLPEGIIKPLWLNQIYLVSNQWTTTLQPPNNALNEFTELITNVNVFAYNYGNIDKNVEIPIRKVKKSIFCEKIIRFKNGKMPDLPIESERLNLIDTYERVGDTYNITLKEWIGTISWSPQETIDGDSASLLLWPNFNRKKWKINYAFFYPSELLRGLKPSIKLINFEGVNLSILKEIKEEASGEKAGGRTESPITHVEIFCEGKPVGIFLDNRTKFYGEPIITYKISLDFGTCNSVLAIRMGNENIPFQFEDESIDILGMNYYLKATEGEIEAYKRSFWFPTYFPGFITSLPSDLLFTTDILRYQGTKSVNEPFRNFTIPHPQFERIGAEKMIISEFKWEDDIAFKGADRKTLVKTYLKMIMHMALATLSRKNASAINVVASYPLAFDSPRYTSYKGCLEELFKDLFEETGFVITFENVAKDLKELVGESYAGKASSEVSPPAVAFVIDIGGGTTDIALAKGDNLLAVDSIRYGGNIYIKFLALKKLEKEGKKIDLESIRIATIYIQKIVRQYGITYLFDMYEENVREIVENALRSFYQGLFEYLYRFIGAFNKEKNAIRFFPVGNGWKFIEGLKYNNKIGPYIENWFKNREKGIDITVNTDFEFGPKEAVAIGALKIANYSHPKLEWPVVAPGIPNIKITWSVEKKVYEKVLTNQDNIPTSGLGKECQKGKSYYFETYQFIKSLEELGIRPTRDIGVAQISDRLNAECNTPDMMYEVHTGQGLSIVRTIFGRFLEKVYSEYFF